MCLTLCDSMDCSLPGSSVHGIFQARVLEWVAISFSRESSRPRDQTWVSRIVSRRFYCRSHQGSQLGRHETNPRTTPWLISQIEAAACLFSDLEAAILNSEPSDQCSGQRLTIKESEVWAESHLCRNQVWELSSSSPYLLS